MRVARALLEFVVGDDALIAVGVVVAVASVWVAAREGVDAWWLVAAAVPLVLGWSLRRATARRGS